VRASPDCAGVLGYGHALGLADHADWLDAVTGA
jgi:hypothetical protein